MTLEIDEFDELELDDLKGLRMGGNEDDTRDTEDIESIPGYIEESARHTEDESDTGDTEGAMEEIVMVRRNNRGEVDAVILKIIRNSDEYRRMIARGYTAA